MRECEVRKQLYLFRLRKTKRIKELIPALERKGGWQAVGEGWEAAEGKLKLTGWSVTRRVVVLRRRKASPRAESSQPLLPWRDALPAQDPIYEYLALVSNLDWQLCSLAANYRERADAENAFDELKNQWGWGGFTTRDLLRCQVAARNVALIYNWWSIFVRVAKPTQAREAITSRPLLLSAVGRMVDHSGQTRLHLTSNHAQAAEAQGLLTQLSLFLSGLTNAAEQLSPGKCWQRIWARVLEPWLCPRGALPAPTG